MPGLQASFPEAVAALEAALDALQRHPVACAASGIMRIEAGVPATFTALDWLLAQPQNRPADATADEGAAVVEAASVYFSPRSSPYPAADSLDSPATPTVAGAPP